MKLLGQSLCLVLLGAGLTAVPGLTAATAVDEGPSAGDKTLVQQMRDNAQGSVSIAPELATKSAGFVRTGRNGDLLPGNDAAPAAKADAFLDRYAPVFGAKADQLVRESVRKDAYGGSTVTYTQEYQGIPVFGAMLKAHLDKSGDLTSVNGVAVPNINISTAPRLSQSQAADRAVKFVRAEPPGTDGEKADTTGIRATSTDLVVYRKGLVRGLPGASELVYQVEVGNGANIREIVFVAAQSGKILNRYSMIHNALDRKVYEVSHTPAALVWEEGDDFPGTPPLTVDQQNIVQGSGESYQFFFNSFGQDSYDDAGATMETVNNDPRISCPNANWNGVTTNYCNGVTSDDVVAHEWGHAYTEFSHNLIYQWQPGALNESYSDIWGETVDLINGRMDGDEGDITTPRPADLCSSHSPALPVLDINSPASIAKICRAGAADFGPPVSEQGTTGDVVLGRSADGSTTGCTPITSNVTGKVALVDRGTCPFAAKVKAAQDAGATAAVVANNVDTVAGMAGEDASITIPSVMVSLSDGDRIKSRLAADTVNVTMRDASGDVKTDSFRWLIGEDSDAFGGAIRDMWTPTCHGDPGRVSDAQYHCSTDDGGGVHSNSGVPNHGYALLVDGGTYNGVTVPAIGLTKAAHIYYQAMTAYQTPTTDFVDHANSLDSACADLTGSTVNGLSTAGSPEQTTPPPAPLPDAQITAADCAAVATMAQAVELRTEPVQCNFKPLLAKNAPANPCGPGTKEKRIWTERFEDGLAGWALTSDAVYPGAPTIDWDANSSLPGGRAGTAAFAVDPQAGSCSQGPDDLSGVSEMTSPRIRIQGNSRQPTRLTFKHYVATETGFDGGNAKISVNGDDFSVIPASAYTYNKPLTIATAAEGNTNPLAGQDGFTGTDGGEVFGSWGESQVNLASVGVLPGDSIRLRFDFGRDGCGGLDGWYVDDIEVSICKAKTRTRIAASPGQTRYGKARAVTVAVDSLGGLGAPNGTVAVRTASGRQLATGRLSNGRVRVGLPARLAVRRHNLVAVYRGSDLHGVSSRAFGLRVLKAISRTRLDIQPSPVVQGRRMVATVNVRATGLAPDGRVVLRKAGKVIARARAVNGRARILIDRNFAVGRHRIKARYLGTSTIRPDADFTSVRVVRRR